MLQYDFEESVGYWITITSHFYQDALNQELIPYGITFRQFQVIGWLVYEGPLSQVELADRMMIEPPTLVRILDRMERDQWIKRESDLEDRRRKVVKVCPEAKPVWSQMVACLKQLRKKATQGMSTEDIDTLKSLLMQVQKNLGVNVSEYETA
ncbi:MarR family transcriptional regulator [uncultured Gimesia sp.]|uniref:MarR family winged helix-turn-helix transcriptional regulator n=1 Tax=uncultured Gimesia sp. TaxID=1678688 RepID=UPI002628BDD7|nr:MarR family transcriptional regulator [uncultured Gimesia sp.]